ncbi:hypothetical protein AAVH_24299 [Aphelenchoides avenae]|nr:hypothetical protein AAVH_24299 [Aphelenchus avenae]
MDMCLGGCVAVHPGNCEGWHQRNDLELYWAGSLYNATLGPYRVVGLGECGLDGTSGQGQHRHRQQKRPHRDADERAAAVRALQSLRQIAGL